MKEFTGSTIQIDGTYPVDQQDTLEEFRAAEHNEKEEFEDVYPAFGSTAKAEGFLRRRLHSSRLQKLSILIRSDFRKIAEMLEKRHLLQPGRTRSVDLYKLRLYP